MKGLILCAGKGTRLQPLSLSQPKALLPVANKPILHYCIEKLAELQIFEIGVVTNKAQEQFFKEKFGSGASYGVKLTYIYQDQPKGISDAVKQAEAFINKEPFILLLGDNLVAQSLAGLKDGIERKNNASILLASVTRPQDYGIAEISGEKIIGLEEKPAFPKTNFAVIGAYAFDCNIFKAVHAISPSLRGEYEITDAIQWLIDHGHIVSYSFIDKHYSDVGTVERWLEANRWMLDLQIGQKIKMDLCIYENCTIIPPVIIGEQCELKDSVIGPYVSVGSNVKIEGCQIENSIILEGTHLKQIPYIVKDSIFGRQSMFIGFPKDNSSIECVLGDKSSIILKNRKIEQTNDNRVIDK